LAEIAFVAPLTGPEAVVGVPMMETVRLAVEAASQNASLPFQLELAPFDDEADPSKARALAEHLAADESVLGVVGHKNSGPCAAAGPVYASAGLAQLTPSATNTGLAQQGWPTFFRLCADNERQARAAAQFALAELQVDRVAAIHDDTDYGRPLVETFVSVIESGRAEVVLVERVSLGQRDFGPTVEALASVSPDLIYFGLTEIESAHLVRALREADISRLCFGADGGRTSPFPELAAEAAEGVYETYAGADPAANPAGRDFLRACEQAYGRCPIFGAEAYDAALVLLESIRRAGVPSRSAVLEKIRELDGFEGVTGPISFTSEGNRCDAQVTIWQVLSGEMILLP